MKWEAVTSEPDMLGESPFWHPGEKMLYWVDIPARLIKRLAPQSPDDVQTWQMPSEPGCIAPLATGGLVIALRDGIYRSNEWGQPPELLVHIDHDTSKFRFNDGKADPAGRFWAGTIYEPRDEHSAQLYCFDLRADNGNDGWPLVNVMARDAVTSNGLAWSPNAKTLYWSDTPQHIIHAWSWDAPANAMSHHRVFRQFAAKPEGWKAGMPGYAGRPDGAAVDERGNYWCAMFEGQRLCKLSPGGELLAEIEVPVQCPTMPCFGGDDLRTLYVTSARDKRPADELIRFPLSGHVIATRVDVPGLPVNFVRA